MLEEEDSVGTWAETLQRKHKQHLLGGGGDDVATTEPELKLGGSSPRTVDAVLTGGLSGEWLSDLKTQS